MADFNSALEGLKLSVSQAELAKYKDLHKSLSKSNSQPFQETPNFQP